MNFLTEEEEIIFNKNITVLYFYASWIPFHKKMMVMISKIEEKYNDIKFLAINVDDFKKLCIRFSIESVPTVVIFNNGTEIKRIVGLVMTSAFKAAFLEIKKDKNNEEISK